MLTESDVSKRVNNLFSRHGYELSITTLRKIISTEMKAKRNEGIIDDEGSIICYTIYT